jgi:hypothetical protein
MPDNLSEKIDELRVQRPRDAGWLAGLTDLVQALPTRDRQRATVLLIANDIVVENPGLCLRETFWVLAESLLGPDGAQQLRTQRNTEWYGQQGEA